MDTATSGFHGAGGDVSAQDTTFTNFNEAAAAPRTGRGTEPAPWISRGLGQGCEACLHLLSVTLKSMSVGVPEATPGLLGGELVEGLTGLSIQSYLRLPPITVKEHKAKPAGERLMGRSLGEPVSKTRLPGESHRTHFTLLASSGDARCEWSTREVH